MLEEIFKALFKRYYKVTNFEAKVLSVDKDNDTCVVQADDEPELSGVKLKTMIGTSTYKLIVYPLVGSYVTVSRLHNLEMEAYVSQVSEVDEIVTNCEQITFNGGTNEGLVKVVELTARINAIETKVNDVISKFNGHVHSGVTTGPGSSAVTPQQITSGNLSQTDKNQIQNPKIKH